MTGGVLPDRTARILRDTVVMGGFGGAVLHPTPHAGTGTHEEPVLSCGWNIMHPFLARGYDDTTTGKILGAKGMRVAGANFKQG